MCNFLKISFEILFGSSFLVLLFIWFTLTSWDRSIVCSDSYLAL